ncbi:DUF86 domain-containing protein [Humibacter soli]
MVRRDPQRLDDIVIASTQIAEYLAQDDNADQDMVFDAIRMRLIEIGEAVKALSPEIRDAYPDVRWSDATRTRDLMAHHYFDTVREVVFESARDGVPVLRESVEQIIRDRG